MDNCLIRDALNSNMNKSRIEHERLHPLLNPEHRSIDERLIDSVHNQRGQFYFVYNGGTGKPFYIIPSSTERLPLQEILGNDTIPAKTKEGEDEPTWIQIPKQFIINSSGSPIEDIVAETYPNFIERQHDNEYLKEQAILTPRNDDMDEINTYIFNKLAGKFVTYNSADEIFKA
ncbi:ATP-dependent DNA helicase PIF1-like protein [Tanacetum coccineum]